MIIEHHRSRGRRFCPRGTKDVEAGGLIQNGFRQAQIVAPSMLSERGERADIPIRDSLLNVTSFDGPWYVGASLDISYELVCPGSDGSFNGVGPERRSSKPLLFTSV